MGSFLDAKDKAAMQRKTMSFRTSSFHRGTILHTKDKAKIAGPNQTSSVWERPSVWEEFTEVSQSVKREIKAIEHHFAVIELEKQFTEVLVVGGTVMTPPDASASQLSMWTSYKKS